MRTTVVMIAVGAVLGLAGQTASAQTTATTGSAATWTGGYVGGSGGIGMVRKNAAETVRFDTNLDGTFGDTIRTAAGADAFGPGFCGGTAINATAASGCTTDDSRGFDIGWRAGYDRQMGRVVIGGVLDVGRTDARDSVTAFSVTPAFYTFTREVNNLAAARGRLGLGMDRVLVYGTGGVVSASVEHTFATSNAVNTFVSRPSPERAWGFQAGGGLEFRVAKHVSLSAEYLFTRVDDQDDATVRAQGPAPSTNPFILVNASGADLQRSGKLEFQAMRFGLNVRF